MKTSTEARKRFLASVLKNFADTGFKYRSVNDGEEDHHGVTIQEAVDTAFAVEISHITLTNVQSRDRQIGLMVVLEADQATMDMITDFGCRYEGDMIIAQKCIDAGTSA